MLDSLRTFACLFVCSVACLLAFLHAYILLAGLVAPQFWHSRAPLIHRLLPCILFLCIFGYAPAQHHVVQPPCEVAASSPSQQSNVSAFGSSIGLTVASYSLQEVLPPLLLRECRKYTTSGLGSGVLVDCESHARHCSGLETRLWDYGLWQPTVLSAFLQVYSNSSGFISLD